MSLLCGKIVQYAIGGQNQSPWNGLPAYLSRKTRYVVGSPHICFNHCLVWDDLILVIFHLATLVFHNRSSLLLNP